MHRRPLPRPLACGIAALAACSGALADEGGVSFWLPGQMGSFAAAPGTPGFSLPVVYYHSSVDASAEKQFKPAGRLTAGLDARADLIFAVPTYVFPQPVGGAQASVGLGMALGRSKVGIHATLTGPNGNTISGAESDTVDGLTDLYPTASLKWSLGNDHHVMAYTMAGVPVGKYNAGQLANLGTNHWSIDGGAGYTYLDAKRGHEASAVLGLTYSFENPDTDYQNGVSMHLDVAASQFLSESWHVGLVGYWYQQLTGDSGAGATLGDFKSRVSGLGPQVGYFFRVGERKWYTNFKVIWEFNANNRPAGWNSWLALDIPFGG